MALFGSSRTAATYDVDYRVKLGEFRADTGEAQRIYERSIKSMSQESLRLALAQDKLDRALGKEVINTREVARAQLGLKRAQEQVASGAQHTGSALAGEERSLGRLARGAVAGSGALRGFGRSLAFASSTFLGGAGFVYALKTALTDAVNLHEQISKTNVVFGQSARDILEWSHTTASSMGLARDKTLEVASTFGALLRPLGIAQKQSADLSKSLTKLGADLASFYNTSVEDALRAVQSGLLGQARPLRRYGVALDEARVKQEAMNETGKTTAKQLTTQDKVLARYAIIMHDTALAQGDFQRTSGGLANQTRILQANLHNLSETVGTALYPQVNKIVHRLNDWLGNTENQKRVQRDVTAAVQDGAKAARGLAQGIGAVNKVVHPLVDGLGGIENAVKVAFGLWLVTRLRLIASSLGLIRTQTYAAATAYDVLAASEAAASAGGVVGRIGQYGKPIPVPSGGGRIPIAAIGGPLTIAATAIVASALFNKGKRDENKAKWDALSAEQQHAVLATLPQDKQDFILHTVGWKLKPLPPGAAPRIDQYTLDFKKRAIGSRNASAAVDIGGGTSGKPLDRASQLSLNLARAQASGNQAAIVKALEDQAAFDRRYIAIQERLLKTDTAHRKQHAATLQRLYGDLQSAQDQIDSIHQQAASKAAAKAADAKRKQDAAARKAKQEAAARLRQQVQEARDLNRTAQAELSSRFPLSAKKFFALGDTAGKAAGAGSTANFQADAFQFLQNLHGFGSQFGSDVFPVGSRSVGGHTIIVNQHFPSPTPDRNREAIYVRHALQNAFQTA